MNGNSAIRRLLTVLAAGGLLAMCGRSEAEFPLERFENPRVVVSDGHLYLFVRKNTGSGEPPAVCFEYDAKNHWTRRAEFRADYRCVFAWGGRFYLFLPEAVIELDTGTCAKIGETRWPFNWTPQSAGVANGLMRTFGVSSDGKLFTAWAPVQPGAKTGPRTSTAPATTTGPASTTRPARATTQPAAATTSPAATRSDDDLILAGAWQEKELRLSVAEKGLHVRTLQAGGKVWVFYTTSESAGGESLWAAEMAAGDLTDPNKLATMNGTIGFAAAEFRGGPMILFALLPSTFTEESGLNFQQRGPGGWLPFEVAANVRNALGEQTLAMSAAAFQGHVELFLATEFRVLSTHYAGRQWTPLEKVLGDPLVDWIIEHLFLLLVVMGLAVALLLGSFIRARYLPRRAVIGGVEYQLAPWWQRAGAYVGDLILVWIGIAILYSAVAIEPTAVGRMAVVFVAELLYFTAFEVRSGKTIGKRLFGVIVVSRNGGYPNWTEGTLRNLPRALLDASPLMPLGWIIGSVFILNTRGSQRVGDFAAGTYVVREHIVQ